MLHNITLCCWWLLSVADMTLAGTMYSEVLMLAGTVYSEVLMLAVTMYTLYSQF